jgi:hypothetical protein
MMQIEIFCDMTLCEVVSRCQSPEEKLPPFLKHFTHFLPHSFLKMYFFVLTGSIYLLQYSAVWCILGDVEFP